MSIVIENKQHLKELVEECFWADTKEEYDEKVNNLSDVYKDINNWDISNVNDLSDIFLNYKFFNQPLNNWDVSNVTNMSSMFNNAKSFNQPLNNWEIDCSNTKINGMFYNATSFNQPLNNWYNIDPAVDMFSEYNDDEE